MVTDSSLSMNFVGNKLYSHSRHLGLNEKVYPQEWHNLAVVPGWVPRYSSKKRSCYCLHHFKDSCHFTDPPLKMFLNPEQHVRAFLHEHKPTVVILIAIWNTEMMKQLIVLKCSCYCSFFVMIFWDINLVLLWSVQCLQRWPLYLPRLMCCS